MDNNLLQIIKDAANEFNFEWQVLAAFVEVESGGQGFDPSTGKIIIQFEPHWFKRKAPYAPSGLWSLNKVERQKAEWVAFNDAFSKDRNAAMEATSIGLGQVMGFHFNRIGYTSVGEMWDDAKKGLHRQVWQMCKFIDTDKNLKAALQTKNWHMVATLYNGAGYKEVARKYGRDSYDICMKEAYLKHRRL